MRSAALVGAMVLASFAVSARAQPTLVQVIDERPIDLGNGVSPLQLSPDGRWIAGWDTERLCFYEVVSLNAVSCVDDNDPSLNKRIDANWIAWSPDGTHVAFTENHLRLVFESDVWVLELESGALTNLTDDGVDGSLHGGLDATRTYSDYFPVWSPDGESLAFARHTFEKDGDEMRQSDASLFRIPANGGEPVLVAQFANTSMYISGLKWGFDSTELVYGVKDLSEAKDDRVEIVNVDTGEARRIVDNARIEEEWRRLRSTDTTFSMGLLLDVSSTGMALIQGSRNPRWSILSWELSPSWEITLLTRDRRSFFRQVSSRFLPMEPICSTRPSTSRWTVCS